MTMSSKQRMVTALEGGVPDRLPVTTHHLQDYFRDKYMTGMSDQELFDHFGMDAVHWSGPLRPNPALGQRFDPTHEPPDNPRFSRRVITDEWRISAETLDDPQYETTRYTISTPSGELTTVLQRNDYTTWVSEHLIKQPRDIDIIGAHVPSPECDVEEVNRQVDAFGDRGIVRGAIIGFDLYGQPGTWQDAAVLVGIEKLIFATFDDPTWVHELLEILFRRKQAYVRSLKGARFDVLEFGGGDASSTVISPKIFRKYVAPYDARLIELAHESGQRIVYHTCGGMMRILEDIADMQPDAMETFTPPGMGGDARLAEAKERIGDRVCMIGGFDQHHHFVDCSEAETRAAVRHCFETAGAGGGYILSPSDHFFDADPALIAAFADEARRCVYA